MVPLVSCPETGSLPVDDLLVVGVSSGGLIERWVTGIENEHDDAHRKQVDLFAHVGPVLVDLGSHVTDSSNHCLQLSSPLLAPYRLREAHVDYFQVEVRIKHDVRSLEISVAKASLVHVHDSLQELLDVEADDGSRELTRVEHILVQLTSSDEFLHDIGDIMGVSTARRHRRLLLKIDILYDAFMVQTCRCQHLLFEQSEGCSTEGGVVVAENFNGVAKIC